MHLLLTRPLVEARAMAARLEAAGHRVTIAPLVETRPVDDAALGLDGVAALVATSRQALRAISRRDDLSRLTSKPLFTVGPATADLARSIGFMTVHEGAGTARDLPALIVARLSPRDGAVLHLAGDHLAFDLAAALRQASFETRAVVVYRQIAATSLSAETVTAIAAGAIDGVILMSPRTADVYQRLARAHHLAHACQRLVHFCLSNTIAKRLEQLDPSRIKVAIQPNSEEMLALIARTAAHSA